MSVRLTGADVHDVVDGIRAHMNDEKAAVTTLSGQSTNGDVPDIELTARPVEGSVAGKTVLVTGSDGFIGSHVVERLIADGAHVRAFCLYNSNGSTGWLDESDVFKAAVRDGQAEVVLGDIRDPEHVMATTEGVDVVLHLAALIPTLLSQLLAGASELKLGDVTPRRDLTFVADTADGFVRAALADVAPGTTIQLGT